MTEYLIEQKGSVRCFCSNQQFLLMTNVHIMKLIHKILSPGLWFKQVTILLSDDILVVAQSNL